MHKFLTIPYLNNDSSTKPHLKPKFRALSVWRPFQTLRLAEDMTSSMAANQWDSYYFKCNTFNDTRFGSILMRGRSRDNSMHIELLFSSCAYLPPSSPHTWRQLLGPRALHCHNMPTEKNEQDASIRCLTIHRPITQFAPPRSSSTPRQWASHWHTDSKQFEN